MPPEELTDFRGCDLHVAHRPGLLGMRFDDIVGRFANARPLGFARSDGRFELNPPAESVIAEGDRLVAIADDVENIELASSPSRLPTGGTTELVTAAVEEHILMIGWNPLGPHLLDGWAAATAPSSTVEVAFDPRLIEATDVVVADLDTEVRLSPTPESSSLNLDRPPTTIVMLGYTSIASREADARTMLDVMQLRRRCAALGTMPRLVVQMLDDEHADLADLTGPDDFLISESLGSRFIAQLIEQPERRAVLLELYGGRRIDPNGPMRSPRPGWHLHDEGRCRGRVCSWRSGHRVAVHDRRRRSCGAQPRLVGTCDALTRRRDHRGRLNGHCRPPLNRRGRQVALSQRGSLSLRTADSTYSPLSIGPVGW